MTRKLTPQARPTQAPALARLGIRVLAAAALASACAGALAVNYPVTPQQRATAQQVAQAGVPLSELAPNAPDSHVVKRGDTLWDISSLFLRSPWRWPELWGMNLDQIRNPHLIFPGQVLVLEKVGGMARLRVGEPVGGGTVKLSPRVRSTELIEGIASVPLHLIEPFLNDAVIFNRNELEGAPRVVAAQEGRVLMSRGDRAYVRGEMGEQRDWRVFRNAKPLLDPLTKEVLGFEAAYVGAARHERAGSTSAQGEIIPATVEVQAVRQEMRVGDRLAPLPPREFINYVPRAPQSPIDGRIASIYGDNTTAGQNQVVALNKGRQDGMERGHVLALWRAGRTAKDTTSADKAALRLPDERHGLLFVFRVFDRMSYALVLNVSDPVVVGDRFTQP